MADDDITGRIESTLDPTAPKGTLAQTVKVSGEAADLLRQAAGGPTKVALQRSTVLPTPDQPLWTAIRNRTNATGFALYQNFINRLLCEGTDQGIPTCGPDSPGLSAGGLGSPSIRDRRTDLLTRPSIYGVDAYQLLKLATHAFLLFESGVVVKGPRDPTTGTFVIPQPDEVPGEGARIDNRPVTFEHLEAKLEEYLGGNVGVRTLPYLKRIVNALVSVDSADEKLPYCEAILQYRLSCPSLLELIWSYWHEEGMLVQTMNAIALRFQNRRASGRDPLAQLELDPLRPLNHLLWGFIQDEYNRLTLPRRAYEYHHHYGLTLVGKAVPKLNPADSRANFVAAFHKLLHRASVFYQEDADTTVQSDGFPLLNALKEVHLLLAEGAHNQFGDLPWTARVEMLIMQWLLARVEIREFLRGRYMVPYKEEWMGAVDSMKRLQSWTDVNVNHFRDLGVFGEQILLSIRYGDWIDVIEQDFARNWARYWKQEIQSYIHSYLAATGVDLAADVADTGRVEDRYAMPSVHLRKRLAAQKTAGALPAPAAAGELLPGVASAPAPLRRASPRLLKAPGDD
jgi:hypothetical protein